MRHSIVLSFDVQYTASASLTVGQNDVTADTLLYVLLYNNTTHFQNAIKIRRQLFNNSAGRSKDKGQKDTQKRTTIILQSCKTTYTVLRGPTIHDCVGKTDRAARPSHRDTRKQSKSPKRHSIDRLWPAVNRLSSIYHILRIY